MSAYVVSRDKLSYNIEELKKRANGVPIWAVIKGDGYGLGVLPLAELLGEHGIDRFCVTSLREARILRDNGFDRAQILMLRSVTDREELGELLDLRVILTIGSWECAQMVERAAADRVDIAEVHLKIDTGMGRYGFTPDDMEHLTALYREMKHLAVSGRDLLELGVPQGREIGRILNTLLEQVVDGTLPNEKAALLQAAREIK